jgi:hypothetical protein
LKRKIFDTPYRRHFGSFYPLLRIKFVLAGSLLIGVQLLIVSSIALPLNTAEAQQNITHVASGTLSGTLTCPDGSSSSATLNFGVEQYRNYRDLTGTQGNFRLAAPEVGGVDGTLTDGHVGEKSFRVTGSEVIGNDCNTLNSDVVISGKCGTGVTVTYKAEDKVIGTFTGDVNCFTRQ